MKKKLIPDEFKNLELSFKECVLSERNYVPRLKLVYEYENEKFKIQANFLSLYDCCTIKDMVTTRTITDDIFEMILYFGKEIKAIDEIYIFVNNEEDLT